MIPKIIHQTWKDKNLPPIIYDLVSENFKILKSNGYELMFWTDEMILKLISEEYPHFYNIYKLARTGVQKGDIARILIIYHYGGIYIDLDVLILKDFAEILDMNSNKLYITYEPYGQTRALYNDDKYICNAFFAANKKNNMLKIILYNIPEYVRNYTENIFQKFDIFGGAYFKTIIDQYVKIGLFKDDVYIIDENSTQAHYVRGLSISPNSTAKIITQGEKLILPETAGIRIVSDTEDSVDCVISYVEIS